ncbi:MAG: UDP-N-acetylmuramate--L-alanine ligase [Actinobacteria bacterium]|nr:UDP-N-acetylmuramate--L-alanine ligase [Actinomycetota bacterium]
MGDLVAHERIHLVGVGGAGMSGLAKLLAQAGHTVTGSDLKPGRAVTVLPRTGVETWVGHRPERAGEWDLVVASSAVPAADPELAAARDAGVEVWERPALLAEITARMPAVGVAGTHGKTTTTAMLVAAARALGRDPSFLVGGEMVQLNTNAHLGEPGLFLLEADEAFGTFCDLSLRGLVVTNVEADHLDHYGTVERLERAFVDVAAGVDGPVVACLDDPGAARVAAAVPGVVGYGFSDEAAWRIEDLRHLGTSVSFRLAQGAVSTPVTVPRPGVHVARNAAGLLALLGEFGVDLAAAAAGLAGFGGVRRRFEVKARASGITVVDDYAHHPTEVAATIAAARDGGPSRVVAVFQPHRYTRTRELAEEFGPALAGADVVIVSDVYAAGEPPIPGVTGRLVADAAALAGAEVSYVPRRADLAGRVAAVAAPGDVVLMLGAGDITLVADEVGALLGVAG